MPSRPRHALDDHSAALPALHLAAAQGDLDAVNRRLAAGESVLLLDAAMGSSALHLAAQGGSAAVIRQLLAHGALVNLQSHSHGMTALMVAVWHRQPDAAAALLAHPDIDLAVRSRLGMTAEDMLDDATPQDTALRASFAAFHARAETQRDGQALVAVLEDPALSAADKDVRVTSLLRQGADPNVMAPAGSPANPGHTPLLIAARDGLADVVRALLAAGADITRVDQFMLAHAAHKAAYMGHADVLRALARHPRFPEIADKQGPFNGYTALHDAVWHGHVEAVRVLIGAGVRLDLRGYDGRTAAEIAQGAGYDAIVALIAACEADRPARPSRPPHDPS